MASISRATTEPFVRFMSFKLAFNRQFKVSVAATLHVSRIVSGAGGTRIMQGLIIDTGEPWTADFNWSQPAEDLRLAMGDTVRLGIVQVHSALDDCLTGMQAELERWAAYSGVASQRGQVDEDTDPLEQFCCTVLGGSSDAFSQVRPVLRYFRLARNCVAHRSSIVSPALEEHSGSRVVQDALAGWAKRQGANPPALPTLRAGARLELEPRHAILYLEAAYRAGLIVDRQLVRQLGLEGLANHAVHHVLNRDSRMEGLSAYRSVQVVISDALTNRYRVAGINNLVVIQILKEVGVWRTAQEAFKVLYGDPPRRFA